MRSIAYVSSARELWTNQQLDELLRSARAWNQPRGLTGMLLYSGGNFMQTVEGPDASITEVFARIKADSRHHGLIVLLEEEVTHRTFPDWTMGYRRVAAGDLGLEGHSDFLDNPDAASLHDRKSSQQKLLSVFRSVVR